MSGGTNRRGRFSVGNNNTYPSDWEEGSRQSVPLRTLSGDEKAVLLHDNGCLFGYRIDQTSGPRKSAFQVAQRQSQTPINVTEMNEIDSDVIDATYERQTNYIHKGWSLSAVSESTDLPWILSRIAKTNGVSRDQTSVTKRVVVQRLRVEMLLEELKPVPEFEAQILAALDSPTRLQKFSAIHRVLEHWGDVIPLVFDIGVSLTITDVKSSASAYLTEKSYFGLRQLATSGTARTSTKGGDPAVLENNVQAWLHRSVPANQWAQVRVVKVAPVTSLLSKQIQTRLSELYESLITYSPVTLSGATSGGHAFDDTSHARRTISTVTVSCDSYYIKSLSVAYHDGTNSDKHGGTGGTSNVFKLTRGEHITELVIWKDAKAVYAIQLITDTGRASQHFGGNGGTPTILRSNSPGGCLTAFSGTVQSDIIHQLQAIWRHDVPCTSQSGERHYSEYYGGTAGSPFNDWPSVKHADSTYISSVRVKCGTYISGIQITYAATPTTASLYHGGSDGQERIFRLERGEHIVTVLGRWNKYIVQLCFVTNQGRTSDIYGGGDGEAFVCRAPRTSSGKPMRLHYILGKSGDWLNGALFVWAPL